MIRQARRTDKASLLDVAVDSGLFDEELAKGLGAVGRGHQGVGLGGRLVEHVEQALQSLGGRVLLVETSSVESFEATRDFYLKAGFVEEARIRDFYAPGDAKVVFWKAID